MDRKILRLLEEVKTQTNFNTKLIQTVMRKMDTNVEESSINLPEEISFPINTMEDIDMLEHKLKDEECVKKLVCVYFLVLVLICYINE